MMTIFTMAFAAVMFSGMVLCMGMFLKHVVNSIPEMTNMSHSGKLAKDTDRRMKITKRGCVISL